MPIFIPFLIIAGVAALAVASKAELELENEIALVGPTSAGKSLLGNDLVGKKCFRVDATHGTTTSVKSVDFADGWNISDTPGVLDGEELAARALARALKSRIVVFCADHEMYRPTCEWLGRFLSQCSRTQKIVIIPYITKCDLRRLTMTSSDAATVEARIRRQFSDLANAHCRPNLDFRRPLLGEPGDRAALKRALQSAMQSTTGFS